MSEVIAFPLGSPLLAAPAGSVASGPGKKVEDINHELEEWAVAQPSVTRCAWCDWTFEGTIAEGQAASKEHRVHVHGVTTDGRRRMRSRSGKRLGIAVGNNDLAENLAKVRKQGGATFVADHPDDHDAVRAASQTEEKPVDTSTPSPRKSKWTAETVLAEIRAYAAEHGAPPTSTGNPAFAQGAVRVFGSWANAVEAAGFPRPTRGTRAAPRTPSAPTQEIAVADSHTRDEPLTCEIEDDLAVPPPVGRGSPARRQGHRERRTVARRPGRAPRATRRRDLAARARPRGGRRHDAGAAR